MLLLGNREGVQVSLSKRGMSREDILNAGPGSAAATAWTLLWLASQGELRMNATVAEVLGGRAYY